jgi:hypothetical protein
MSAIKILYSLWNCDFSDLTKLNKIECVKKINALTLNAVLSRCDEADNAYWNELFEAIESLLVYIIDRNPEGRHCIQFPSDRTAFQLIDRINKIQSEEEEHRKYILSRKERKATYRNERTKPRRKRSKSLSDCETSDSD